MAALEELMLDGAICTPCGTWLGTGHGCPRNCGCDDENDDDDDDTGDDDDNDNDNDNSPPEPT